MSLVKILQVYFMQPPTSDPASTSAPGTSCPEKEGTFLERERSSFDLPHPSICLTHSVKDENRFGGDGV